MHDLKSLREDPAAFDAALARRGLDPLADQILESDAKRRAMQTRLDELRNRRKTASKEIGKAKGSGDNVAAEALMAEVAGLKDEIPALEAEEKVLGAQVESWLTGLPNRLDADVPPGKDEDDNIELRQVGTPKSFDFAAKRHFELGEGLGLMDFDRAAKLSGARFVVLKGALARLERALGQYMLDLHTGSHGYEETQTPVIVRSPALFGTGQLPKFEEDLFRLSEDFWLIPTAEVTLTNLVAGEIVDEASLPRRLTAFTQCFRSEAGAAGKDTRGMIRQHQFEKVELVSVVHPEESEAEHQRMTGCAEAVLQGLGLAYRVMMLSSGDTGFSARKTYDLEVWLPGEGRYREISSCSNTGDFQARRMNARFRSQDGGAPRFVHTLNGSGVAVGRALIAVLETYQDASGGISVPEVLKPYMGGLDYIAPLRASEG